MTDGPPPLPPSRRTRGNPGRYLVGMVCSGNICRSPTAEVVLEARLQEAGLADRVAVASCGLGDWHVGNPMDHRAAETLGRAGYDSSRHRAQQLDASWSTDYDLLLAMDAGHLRDLGSAGLPRDRTRLYRDFDPDGPGTDVPDPYYGGQDGFEEVLAMVERTSSVLVTALARHPELGGR